MTNFIVNAKFVLPHLVTQNVGKKYQYITKDLLLLKQVIVQQTVAPKRAATKLRKLLGQSSDWTHRGKLLTSTERIKIDYFPILLNLQAVLGLGKISLGGDERDELQCMQQQNSKIEDSGNSQIFLGTNELEKEN